jgi:hypothetical protein
MDSASKTAPSVLSLSLEMNELAGPPGEGGLLLTCKLNVFYPSQPSKWANGCHGFGL